MSKLGFLEGGGEMGELTRNYNWEKTSLGKPETWPLSLQTTIGTILHSAFPMFLFWGKDLLCFYNDAYRPSLGNDGKHPLLAKGGKESWPEIWHFIGPLIDKVMTTGEAAWFEDQFLPIYRNGKIEDVYWTFSYSPAYGDDSTIQGVFVTCTETTAKVIALNELTATNIKIEKSQEQLLTYFEQSPVAIATISKENLTFRLVNPFYGELVGRKPEEIENKPLLEALPEIKGQGFDDLLREVIATGKPFIAEEVSVDIKRKGKLETIYVNLTYQPQRDTKGDIVGILVVATDVTQQVHSRKKVEESEAHLLLLRNAIPAMVFYLDEEQRYRSYNGVFMDWFAVNATEALGKTTREFIGEAAYAKAGPYLDKAYAGERVEYHMHAPQRIGGEKWLNIVYTPHKNPEEKVIGVIVHATDITEHILAQRIIEESEARFRTLLQEAPVAATLFRGPDLIVEIANELTLKYWGKSPNIIGKPLAEAAPELEDQQMIALVRGVYENGGLQSFAEVPIKFVENGVLKDGFYSFSIKALYNSNGDIESVLSTGIEVTEQVNVRKQIEQKEKELRDLIAASPIGICVVSGSPLKVEEVNERFLQISGKTREQYAAAPYWEVLKEVAHIFQQVLEGVFTSGQKYTTEENEMVLIRDGVPENIFLTFEYIPLFENDKVIKVIVMVVEVTHQIQIRKEIEEAVVQRTKELAESNLQLRRSNEELEQFAYIASHDLQEPIRKISTFTQMLELSLGEVSGKSKDYISKIYNSTDRMSKLVRDVLAYSRIRDISNQFESVDLNAIIETVKLDFEITIAETHARIEVVNLPTIEAISGQMIQLFGNLLSNALKYRRPDVAPIIKISASLAKREKILKRIALDPNKEYWHIEFSDDGIGFSEEHLDKIFKIFQRLHGKAQFEGTGIGLAICMKIVHNHGGHISAAVGENGGAVFNILLPAKP